MPKTFFMKNLLLSLFILISLFYLNFSFAQNSKEWDGIPVAGDYLNMRSGPGLNHGSVGKLRIGDQVDIIDKTYETVRIGNKAGKWMKVKSRSNGQEGWVFDYYLAYRSKCSYYRDFPPTFITEQEGERLYKIGFRSDESSWYARDVIVVGSESRLTYTTGRVYNYRNLILFTDSTDQNLAHIFYYPEGTKYTVGRFGKHGINDQPLTKLWEKDATYENFKSLFQPVKLPVHIGHPVELEAPIPGIRDGYYIPLEFNHFFPKSGRVGFSNAEKFSEYNYNCLHKPEENFCDFGLKAHVRMDLGHGLTGFIVSGYSWASWAGGVDYHQVHL